VWQISRKGGTIYRHTAAVVPTVYKEGVVSSTGSPTATGYLTKINKKQKTNINHSKKEKEKEEKEKELEKGSNSKECNN